MPFKRYDYPVLNDRVLDKYYNRFEHKNPFDFEKIHAPTAIESPQSNSGCVTHFKIQGFR